MKYDLNQLLAFCQKNELSFSLNYDESSGTLYDLEIHSAGEQENFHMKRVPDIDSFIEAYIEAYEEHLMTKENQKIKYEINLSKNAVEKKKK